MSAWIGPLGSLIDFKCPSAVDVTTEDGNVYFRGLGGAVSVTRIGSRPRPRVWEVRVSTARPDQVAALQGLTDGEWGAGPFVFVPPAAETLNLLGKADALCLGTPGDGYRVGTPGTVETTTEGPAGGAYLVNSDYAAPVTIGTAPVIPGRPVTGKAWMVRRTGATGTLGLTFYTATGSPLTTTAPAATTTGYGEFLHTTAVAPDGAAYASLSVSNTRLVTRPQVTWTDGPRRWVPSAASTNVVVSPLTASVRRATGRAGSEQVTDHAFTVTELSA